MSLKWQFPMEIKRDFSGCVRYTRPRILESVYSGKETLRTRTPRNQQRITQAFFLHFPFPRAYPTQLMRLAHAVSDRNRRDCRIRRKSLLKKPGRARENTRQNPAAAAFRGSTSSTANQDTPSRDYAINYVITRLYRLIIQSVALPLRKDRG